MSDREKAFEQWWHLTSHLTRPEQREGLARQAYYAAWGGGGSIDRITAERDAARKALEEGVLSCLRHTHDRLIDYPEFETLRITINAEVRAVRDVLASTECVPSDNGVSA